MASGERREEEEEGEEVEDEEDEEERKKERLASNGSEKLFRYDRNLRTRPAAGIRTSRTTATPLDFLLVSQPSLRSIRDFNFAICGGDIRIGERRTAAIRYACRAEIARCVCPHQRLACNEQSHSDCACHVNYMRETRIPIAVCWEISAVGRCRGAQIYIPFWRGTNENSRAAQL